MTKYLDQIRHLDFPTPEFCRFEKCDKAPEWVVEFVCCGKSLKLCETHFQFGKSRLESFPGAMQCTECKFIWHKPNEGISSMNRIK